MEGYDLTRREFIGVVAASLGVIVSSNHVNAKEIETTKRESCEDNERLNKVIIEVVPLEDNKDKVRIFEITTKVGEWSRVSEVDRHTGREYGESQVKYSACNRVSAEEIKSQLMMSGKTYGQIRQMLGEEDF